MARFGVKEVCNVTFIDLVTGKPALFLDTLKMSNLESDAETVFATGGQGGGRLMSWAFNKTATFTLQDALINPKALAMKFGTEVEKKKHEVFYREVLVAVDGAEVGTDSKVTLANTPIGAVSIFLSTDGIEYGEEIVGTVAGADVEFAVAELPVGSKVIAHYKYETAMEAEVVQLRSDKFAGYYMVVGDTVWRNEKGQDEKVQIQIPKAMITSQFALNMQPDGEPSVLDIALDVFKTDGNEMVNIVRY